MVINHKKRGKWESLSTDADEIEAIVILFPSPSSKNIVAHLAHRWKEKGVLTKGEYIVHLTKVQLVAFEGLQEDERLLVIDRPIKHNP